MRYFFILFMSVALVICTAMFLLLAYTSDSIGLSLCIGAILVFVVGQFLDLLQDELTTIRTLYAYPNYWKAILECPHSEPLHHHHDGCPACYMSSIEDTESTHC